MDTHVQISALLITVYAYIEEKYTNIIAEPKSLLLCSKS